MKVSKTEYLFVTKLWWFGKYRDRVARWGIKYTIALIIAYIGSYMLGLALNEPSFVWVGRGLIALIIFGYIYDACRKRVERGYRDGR